jgi:hypothetical protein
MRGKPAPGFDVCENECAYVVKGPQFSGASWGARAYLDGSENEGHAQPRSFQGASSITNRSERWQAAQRNVEKSGLSSLASSTAIVIGAPHSGHLGISSVANG